MPFVVSEARGRGLWQGYYNGHRFFGIRKLRGVVELDDPTVCALRDRLLFAYTITEDGHSRIALTVTDTVGAYLTSRDFRAGEGEQRYPSLTCNEKAVYLAYEEWRTDSDEEPRLLGLRVAKLDFQL
jgi:hypothetical protein